MADWSENVPVLKDWVSLRYVAQALGISRQQVHLLAQQGTFASLHKVDGEGRPSFMVKRSDLDAVLKERAKAKREKAGTHE